MFPNHLRPCILINWRNLRDPTKFKAIKTYRQSIKLSRCVSKLVVQDPPRQTSSTVDTTWINLLLFIHTIDNKTNYTVLIDFTFFKFFLPNIISFLKTFNLRLNTKSGTSEIYNGHQIKIFFWKTSQLASITHTVNIEFRVLFWLLSSEWDSCMKYHLMKFSTNFWYSKFIVYIIWYNRGYSFFYVKLFLIILTFCVIQILSKNIKSSIHIF